MTSCDHGPGPGPALLPLVFLTCISSWICGVPFLVLVRFQKAPGRRFHSSAQSLWTTCYLFTMFPISTMSPWFWKCRSAFARVKVLTSVCLSIYLFCPQAIKEILSKRLQLTWRPLPDGLDKILFPLVVCFAISRDPQALCTLQVYSPWMTGVLWLLRYDFHSVIFFLQHNVGMQVVCSLTPPLSVLLLASLQHDTCRLIQLTKPSKSVLLENTPRCDFPCVCLDVRLLASIYAACNDKQQPFAGTKAQPDSMSRALEMEMMPTCH